MNRIKTWQAVVLAALAVGVAVAVIYRTAGTDEKGAPIPAVYSGPPPASRAASSGSAGAASTMTSAPSSATPNK